MMNSQETLANSWHILILSSHSEPRTLRHHSAVSHAKTRNTLLANASRRAGVNKSAKKIHSQPAVRKRSKKWSHPRPKESQNPGPASVRKQMTGWLSQRANHFPESKSNL